MGKPSEDMKKFKEIFKQAKNILVLTGAGVSAESGVPTFRGAGGLWRLYKAQDLASLGAFKRNPSLVWEFYHYRRELMKTKHPNPAHIAIAETEKKLLSEGKNLRVVTQNIDELHWKAGSKKIIELHGSLFKTRCTQCHEILANTDSPICSALEGKGQPDAAITESSIPVADLPRCKTCSGLLRPHVVWFGESLDPNVLDETVELVSNCDLCLVVGTSSVVYPAAMFAPQIASRGVPVAEFNIETTPETHNFGFYFEGPCGETLPQALEV